MGRVGGGVRKQSDIDKARERALAAAREREGEEAVVETVDDSLYGPVKVEELLAARGVARAWLHVVKPVQRLMSSIQFQVFITMVIIVTAVMIGFATFPTADLYEPQLLVIETTITTIFVLEIVLKMIAKKWRPHYFFADKVEWHCARARAPESPPRMRRRADSATPIDTACAHPRPRHRSRREQL